MLVKATHFFSVFSFVVGLILVFWVGEATLKNSGLALNIIEFIGPIMNSASEIQPTTGSTYQRQGFSITERTVYQFLLWCSFALGVLTTLLSLLARFKFGKSKLFPAVSIAGVCLAYIALERGAFIGVFVNA